MHRHLVQLLRLVAGSVLICGVVGCVSTATPRNVENICQMFDEKRSWYRSAVRSERSWGIPISVMMAVIYKESSFRATVRPARKKILGVFPGRRPSTSLGYSQAKDETWGDYMKDTRSRTASRTNFADSIDFVGWYLRRSVGHLGISANNAELLYVSYHQGLSGYQSGQWRNSTWLKGAAAAVQRQANRYESQLKNCTVSRNR